MRSFTIPAIEPMAAARETSKQIKLNTCKPTHFDVHDLISFWEMYMDTGKYTVSGQKAVAPKSPNMSLKKGSTMDTSVVATTKRLLHRILNKLIRIGRSNGLGILCSWLRIVLVGHFPATQSSTNANTGCANTYDKKKSKNNKKPRFHGL